MDDLRESRPSSWLTTIVLAAAVVVCAFARGAGPVQRPRLQIINGSDQLVDVFWLKTENERVPNGLVAPGRDSIIGTTLGHRFAVVGRADKAEALLEAVVPVQAFRFDPSGRNGVPAFYAQSVSAGGFPIVASARVNPYALREAAYLVDLMLAKRPDVRTAMIQSGSRLCILAHNEFTTDLPEFARMREEPHPDFPKLSGRDYWDARCRGTGGSTTDPFCTCAEENLLGYPGDPYAKECILIHEFAHNIHLRGLVNVDPTFDTRLRAAYDAAMKSGLWKGKYASVNHHEYFAEGVQSWFDNNRENDPEHNHVNTRAELLDYDPGLAGICREVFGDTAIHYTKPATRLTGHMTGYDPTKAPTFVWPEHLAEAKAEIKARAANRDKWANGRETRIVAGWTVHISKDLLATEPALTSRALELLRGQLEHIVHVVPKGAVAELQKVPLYFSPPYKGFREKAEYHPDRGWLIEHDRDSSMARAVEFTNIRIFEAETRRMPNFVLHELAHAYHDRVLGHDEPRILAAFANAKASGKYEKVERQDSEGRKRLDRAYALTNPREYFAECTEAFFGHNDFFPYTRDELKRHDLQMFEVLEEVWRSEGGGT